MYFIAVYDIEQRRVGKMLKLFRKYLTWVQNSVFEGELTEATFAELKVRAGEIMHPETDSIIFFSLPFGDRITREVMGIERNSTDPFV